MATAEGVLQNQTPIVPQPVTDGKVFKEVIDLRSGAMQQAVREGKKGGQLELSQVNDTIFGTIATNPWFEYGTMVVIGLNAIFLGYDTEWNAMWGKPSLLYDGPIFFQVAENIFAIYFTAELAIRFLAYKRKTACICDAWFVFDGALVVLMIVETWILPAAGVAGELGGLGILRVIRIARMAKLLRNVTEFVLLIKGIAAASRAVFWTAVLLFLMIYAVGILFTNEFHQGKLSDDEVPEEDIGTVFGTMGKSMWTLLIMGTILDDVTYACDMIRSTKKTGILIAFIIFIVISSFMMLNLLVGILVEVVQATAEGEHKNLQAQSINRAVQRITKTLDKDDDGLITREEFESMQDHESVMNALKDLSINKSRFHDLAKIMFEVDEEEGSATGMQASELGERIVLLRPDEKLGALDFAAFRSQLLKKQRENAVSINDIHGLLEKLSNGIENGCYGKASPTGPLGPRPKAPQTSLTTNLSGRPAAARSGEGGPQLPGSVADGDEAGPARGDGPQRGRCRLDGQLEYLSKIEPRRLVAELERRFGLDREEPQELAAAELVDQGHKDFNCAKASMVANRGSDFVPVEMLSSPSGRTAEDLAVEEM